MPAGTMPQRPQWIRSVLLAVSAAAVLTSEATAQRSAPKASVSGVVLVDSLERPIADAEVELVGTPYRTRSDSAGAFSLRGIPIGAYRLQLRAVGYAPLVLDVQLAADGLDGVEALLRPVAQELERVRIRASLTPTARHLIDFENRRKFGIGKFIDSTRLWAYGGPQAWYRAIVSEVPGMRAMAYGSSLALARGGRGPSSLTKPMPAGDGGDQRRGAQKACYLRVIIDGQIRYNTNVGETLFDVSNYDGPPIVAAEVYSSAQLPAEFNRMSDYSCGAIVLWTKR